MIKVSIIIPCYKTEQYLDKCVKSVINQTLKDIEIILVDDGSPDNIPIMCDEWAKNDARIKVVHKENEGLGMACNSGIDIASGKYVAFLDSDDWIDSTMYEAMYTIAELHNAQAVFTGLKRVNEHNEVRLMPHPQKKRIYAGTNEIQELMLDMIASEPTDKVERHIQMSAKTVLYQRNLLTPNSIRFESERIFVSEDLLFNLDFLSCATCVVVLPQYYYNYFFNENSISQTPNTKKLYAYENIYHEMRNRYTPLSKSTTYQNRSDRMIAGFLRQYMRQIVNSSRITYWQKINMLREICHSKIWKQIADTYPFYFMAKPHQMLFKLISLKAVHLLYIIFNFLNRR